MHLAQRIIQRLLAAVAGLLVVAVVALGLAAYLTASGRSLVLLKRATAHVGTLFAGQRTEHLRVDAALFPEERRLEARARLTLRAENQPRRRFYFLLNRGLSIRNARVVDSAAHPSVYQLWLIVVVDLGHPVAVGESVDVEFDYDGDPTAGGVGVGAALLDSRDVLLSVDDFWYPSDVQSFFSADVTVTLPARLTLVHNGREAARVQRGDRQRVRWHSERPIGGMALIAGLYRKTTATIDGEKVQLHLPDDVSLDSDTVLRDMADANALLTQRFGPSGLPQLTLFVNRRIRRGFNDGAGLMGLSIRYFRRGEYGFHTIAHEIAHNWWGSTVAERWLAPGTGGEWIVEGLAEYSSLLATEARWGRDALTRRMQEEFFDPARQATVADMSVLDNALAEATARDTIYRKGAYVAMMLRHLIGDEAMQRALQQFVERFRYAHAGDRDLEAVVRETSGQDVGSFFSDWVRSAKLADLVLEPSGSDRVDVRNRGEAAVPGEIGLWLFSGRGEPEQRAAKVGETVPLPNASTIAVLDPQLAWADMVRGNNRSPRLPQPRFVAVSSRGDLLVASGEPHPWAPATLAHRTRDGKQAHLWEFERGFAEPPVWSTDGGRILASVSEATGAWPAIVSLNAVDGTRATVGYGSSPAFGATGRIFATRGDRLMRFDPTGSQTITRLQGQSIESPLPSPSGRQVAYVAARGNAFELRMCDQDGAEDRSLLTWDRDRFIARWAPDESRLYAVIGGDWDWQIWEIPADNSPVRVLAREAAAIRDLAVSPTGEHLAFAAAPAVRGPVLPHQLYVLDLKSGRARVPDAGGDVWQVAWETPDTVIVVIGSADAPVVIPEPRTLRRIRLSDGSSESL